MAPVAFVISEDISRLKGGSFQSAEFIKQIATKETENDFYSRFEHLQKLWRKRVATEGRRYCID